MIVVVDIDGVIADASHREHHLRGARKDWDAFFGEVSGDAVLPRGVERVRELSREHEVVLLTGRPESCRVDTVAWLDRHGVPYSRLLMRPVGDHRPAQLFKRELVMRTGKPNDVAEIIDDDSRVISALVSAGYIATFWVP